jgi:hypothetical protein
VKDLLDTKDQQSPLPGGIKHRAMVLARSTPEADKIFQMCQEREELKSLQAAVFHSNNCMIRHLLKWQFENHKVNHRGFLLLLNI